MKIENYIIIVAGGKGQRLKSDLPKQFIAINNTPIICYTIKAFLKLNKNAKFVIVCNKKFIQHCKTIIHDNFSEINFNIVAGGNSRFHSVLNGLNFIQNFTQMDIVSIHDAVRPFVSENLLSNLLKIATEKNCAIPAIDVSDSIYQFDENKNAIALPRNNLKAVQTPQCFNIAMLKTAYKNAVDSSKDNFTDDASVWKYAGNKLQFVAGENENIKITYQKDLIIAKAKL